MTLRKLTLLSTLRGVPSPMEVAPHECSSGENQSVDQSLRRYEITLKRSISVVTGFCIFAIMKNPVEHHLCTAHNITQYSYIQTTMQRKAPEYKN